jgi:hypothetical protein
MLGSEAVHMQFNIYIPKSKASILSALEYKAKSAKRPKNELVLEALERYLRDTEPAALGLFKLGAHTLVKRADIYEGRFKS